MDASRYIDSNIAVCLPILAAHRLFLHKQQLEYEALDRKREQGLMLATDSELVELAAVIEHEQFFITACAESSKATFVDCIDVQQDFEVNTKLCWGFRRDTKFGVL